MAQAGDGVAGAVRRDEPDDEFRDAPELRRLSQQRTGRSTHHDLCNNARGVTKNTEQDISSKESLPYLLLWF